ncbi:MAG: tRNA 4-thiouridine(8) synthase ThiI, partial [Desulfobacterales bacterium]
EKAAGLLELPLRVVDISFDHLCMLRNPKHGYGSHMNPCIDCHALMLREAGEIMRRENGHFVFSGEVLGQRPLSQNKAALATVARESGLNELLLRPLSAKLLPITLPEREGWVNRDQLLDISGRSRKRQMEMAREFGISEYPTPAGGCLLTEEGFSRRLQDLFAHEPNPELREIELLKVGRHFRLDSGVKLVVGRNQLENQIIDSLMHPGDLHIVCADRPGPTVLAANSSGIESLDLAASVCAAYSSAPTGSAIQVLVHYNNIVTRTTTIVRRKEDFRASLI